MTPANFIAKWTRVHLPERAASQEHFIDVCRLLGQPTPAERDATGTEYTFEKGVAVTGPASRGSAGAGGYADVWWRGKFGWEYKRRGKYEDLTGAYRQLCQYREALENPPLLIVSDIARTEIHTNFTGTAKRVHTVLLEEMDRPEKLRLLRRVFTDPESFRPDISAEAITREAAEQFALLSQSLQNRGHDPHTAAHFLMKCMFCLFAEDIDLLPGKLFTRLLGQWRDEPARLPGLLTELFERMRTGGAFGTERIAWFNGGLFDESPALDLTRPEIGDLLLAAGQDWSAVEPSIFGTLFERSLDPSKRSQIGAHYTGRDDIMLVVDPVVMDPLRRRWDEVRGQVEQQLARRERVKTRQTKAKADRAIADALGGFLNELGELRVLDPACGSGNFLYVAIQQLLDLEKEVITFAARPEIALPLLPTVRPTQLHGIEINPFAAELAQVVIWIGYLQWMRDNGFNVPRDPILEPLQTIECRDAILCFEETPQTFWAVGKDSADLNRGQPAKWPDAHFIIGNPPFLGSKLFRQYGLPDAYVEGLYNAYDIPNSSDLCCYWFERARQQVEFSSKYGGKGWGKVPYGFGTWGRAPAENVRVGLLATQGIRGGANRAVLERVKQTSEIFMAWSDRQWILEGAAVRVSIVGYGACDTKRPELDGNSVGGINSNLSAGIQLGRAQILRENTGLAFMGVTPSGKFEVNQQTAATWLRSPNSSGASNADVLRPWLNAKDLTQRMRGVWIIDFGCHVDLQRASSYEAPFEHVRREVAPRRNSYRTGKRGYWCFERPRPAFREAVAGSMRFLVTPMVSKHRMFVWEAAAFLPANLVIAFAREDGYFFGVLHSSIHELWALGQGTQLESRPRYTPTTCFETFPLPWPPGSEPPGDAVHARIGRAAAALNEQRQRWLNPPEWIDPIAGQIDAREDFSDVPEDARELIRQSAIMAEAARDKDLRARTLTNLYNERPTWLRLAHGELDRAVLAAYAAVDPEGGWNEAWAEVWADTGAGRPLPEGHALAARRAEVDERVLANLLRLNLARSEEAQA